MPSRRAWAIDGAEFYVVVTDANGSVQSTTVLLTVTIPEFELHTDLPDTVTAMQNTPLTLRVLVDAPAVYDWYEVDVGLLESGTNGSFTIPRVTPEDAGREFYAIAITDDGRVAVSNTAMLEVIGAFLIDTTDPQAPPAPGPRSPSHYRTQDWAGLVAAAEGRKPTYIPDYEFSGRTFSHRDVLLNPRRESEEGGNG